MSVASNDRETVAWAWPFVFGLLMLVTVSGIAYAVVWSWSFYAGSAAG
jgi:hypothetical protein